MEQKLSMIDFIFVYCTIRTFCTRIYFPNIRSLPIILFRRKYTQEIRLFYELVVSFNPVEDRFGVSGTLFAVLSVGT